MTFDDGILTIYNIIDTAPKGAKPQKKLIKYSRECYGLETIGLARINYAAQVKSRAEELVHIWQDRKINNSQICALDGGVQYKIVFVQHTKDEDEQDITRLTLERLAVPYELQ